MKAGSVWFPAFLSDPAERQQTREGWGAVLPAIRAGGPKHMLQSLWASKKRSLPKCTFIIIELSCTFSSLFHCKFLENRKEALKAQTEEINEDLKEQ